MTGVRKTEQCDSGDNFLRADIPKEGLPLGQAQVPKEGPQYLMTRLPRYEDVKPLLKIVDEALKAK